MKAQVWMLVIVLSECGGASPCPTAQLCGKICCAADSQCTTDQAGAQYCGLICQKSADCGAGTPCCQPLLDAESNYAGSGVCAANPDLPGAYACLCVASSECGTSAECVPDIGAKGTITGPYICALNDGNRFDGCRGSVVFCDTQGEYCATDQAGNQFCSADCLSDSMCGNTGVACCNASCSPGKCCGLCGR